MLVPAETGASASYDVVVVGARVAGASTAMLLARQGRRVLVVDRAALPSDTLSTHALWMPAVLQLDRFGVLDDVVAAGTPPVDTLRVTIGDTEIAAPVRGPGHVQAVYAPRRTVLDPILLDAARAAGAEVRTGITVTGLLRDRAGRVAGVTGRDASGRPFSARARVVVGADGAQSRVARLVDAPRYREHPATAAAYYAYFAGLEDRGFEYFFAEPRVQAGVFPTNFGEACVYVNLPVEDLDEVRGDSRRALAGWGRLLGRAAPTLASRLEQALRVSPLRGSPGRPSFFRVPFGPGWALVGDAGYLKDPFSGHGITDALRDAELLAEALGAGFDDAFVERDALQAYQDRRDALSDDMYEVTRRLAAWEWTPDDVLGVLSTMTASIAAEAEFVAARLPLDAPGARALAV